MEKETQKKIIQYGIFVAILVVVSSAFLFSGNKTDIVNNTYTQEQIENLGSLGSQGEYAVKTTGHHQVVSAVPVVLHRIIVGTANDAVYFSNSATAPADNGALIKPNVASSLEIGAVYSEGLVANVTSTDGVIFVYSNYK